MSTIRPPARRASLRDRLTPLPRPVRRVLGSRVLEALTAPHGTSRYLEQIHPLWSLDERRAVVTEVRRETADTSTLTLAPVGWSAPEAGQHVRLTVEIDGVRRGRAFSVSSSAHRADGRLQITVKANPDGHVSRHLAHRARPGDVVEVTPGDGRFLLPDPRPEDLLLLSGGSGITPVMAMLRTLIDEGHRGRVRFVHYARTRDDVIFADELDAIARRGDAEVHVILTADEPGAPAGPALSRSGLRGRIGREHLDELLGDRAAAEAFACGPAGMLEVVEELWAADGIAGRLHVERYQAPVASGPVADAGGRVMFTDSGLAVDSDGRSLLEQAETAGLRPDFGCRMGICHGCVRRKPSGAVRDVRSDVVHDEDDEDVQLCITVPLGDVEIAL